MVNDMIMSVPIKALLLLLPATNLMYYFKDYEMKKISVLLTMLLLSIIFVHAQQISIKGIVIDKKLNEPIIGASVSSVSVQGTTIGTVTNLEGNFSLKNVPKGSVLTVSYIGYTSQNITINGNQTTFKIEMSEDTKTLDEVVVVGFGTQKKVNLTGAVATVDAKTLDSRPVTSVAQALQGVVPGLNISANARGGKLDQNPTMNIRGTGNLGTGSSDSPLVLIDGVEGDINSINPQDIANISVLKDAASASIYGSRAPFGVILVTTKAGQQGKATIQYSDNFRWSRPTNIPNMLDSYRFAQYFNKAQFNSGKTTTFLFNEDTMDRIQKYMAGEYQYTSDPTQSQGSNFFQFNMRSNDNQNWPKNFIDKTAFGQEHNLSVSGGSEKTKYYISGAFLSQEGQMNYSDEKKNRYNISGKVSSDVTQWLTLELNTRFIRTDIGMPTFLKVQGDRFFPETTKLYPMMPLYDNNGHYTRNPKLMQLTSGGRSNTSNDSYFTQGAFTLKPLKGLAVHGQATLHTESFRHQYSINKVYLYTRDNQPVEEAWLGGDPDLAAGKTYVQSETKQVSMMTTSLYADYEHSWNNHNFKAMIGMNTEYYYQNKLMGKRFDVIDENVPSINTANGISSNSGGANEWATMGYFARLNYDYNGRYLFETTIRRDGTSRFRGNERWGNYPSFSLGWNIAREGFWSPLEKYINTLKPRFTYGSLGNQNTDNWYPTYAIQNITVGSADAGGRWLLDLANKSNIASSPGLVSTLLTWERITSYNIGVDFGALSNRLTGYFEYYVRDTKDMVGPAQEISSIVGAGAPKMNNTALRTKGWELQIGWQDRIGQLGYNVSFNLSDAQTEVTEFPNPDKQLKDGDGNDYYWEGKKLGEIWGFKTVGMAKTDQEMADWIAQHDQSKLKAGGLNIWKAGDIMYANLDDNPAIEAGTSATDPKDLTVIGNSTPRYRFGITLGANYKGFDLNIMFQGVAKRDYWIDGMIFWGVNGGQWSSTGYEEHWDFFRPEGDELGANTNAYFPRPIMDSRQNQQVQSRYLQDASYIRLKNLQVGYTIPKYLTKKIGLEKLRVFFSGDNLWTGTKINKNFDPEALWQNGMTYPLSRTLSCGVNIVL